MNKKLKMLLAMLTVTTALGVAAACSDSSSSTSSSSSSSSSAPAEKEKYEVKFVDDDNTVLSSKKVEEGTMPEAPANPTKAEDVWYTYVFAGWDKEVKAAEDDVIYKATYTRTKKTYTVTFMVDSEEVASETYDVDTTKESITPDLTEYDTVADQDVAWEAFELDGAANKVVNAVRTNTEYQIAFLQSPMIQMPIAPVMTYTVQERNEFEFPAVPAELQQTGYTVVWAVLDGGELRAVTANDLVSNGISVYPKKTPNTYKVTFNAGTGTATDDEADIVYDSEYTLPTATPAKSYQEFLGWYDEEDNLVEDGEAWNIAENVTLTAKYSAGITFNTMTSVPSYFTAADTTESLSITNLNGNKVLEIKSNGSSPGMDVTRDALAVFFEDSNVDYIAFEAKTGASTTTNFRRYTWRSNNGGEYANVTYEVDYATEDTGAVTGIRSDAYKTFFFSRTDYNHWVNKGVTEQRFIASGNMTAGDSIYIDNIRPATSADYNAAKYSLDNGGARTNNGNLLMYLGDDTSAWAWGIMKETTYFDANSYGYTSENVTDGSRAFWFKTFANETATVKFNSGTMYNAINATGYYAVDIYVPADSDATFTYLVTTYPGVTPKKGAWTTVYVNNNSQCIKITDTTGSKYLIDNFRSITKEEYFAGAYGFEANTSGIRLNGTNYLWYAGADHTANRYSIAFTNAPASWEFSSEQVKEGGYSVKITHAADQQVNLQIRSDSEFYANMKNGFSFWIYSNVDIAAASICNSYDQAMVSGISVTANEWTQIIVTAEDLKDLSGDTNQSLSIKGAWTTIYLDNFQPLPATDAE